MRPRPHATRLLALLALLSVLSLAAAQPGEGSLGVSPTRLDVPDARRGETYQRAITLQNQFDAPTDVTLEGFGETGAWTAFSPGASLTLPARGNATVLLNVTVPADAQNGDHEGHVQVATEPKGDPEGSGYGVRYAVSVVLGVTVGGEETRRVTGISLDAPDVERGAPALALLALRNDGNVRATVTARAQAFPLDGGAPAAQGEARATLVPGETRVVEIPLAGLALGQYRVRATLDAPDAHEAEAHLKVVEPGTLGKSGLLRAILHAPRATEGRPLHVTVLFENTGNATIGGARFVGTVSRLGQDVAVLETPTLVVRPGERVELGAFHTPDAAGEHVIRGRVLYDGFQTPVSESLFTVEGSATGSRTPLPLWTALAGLALAAAWMRRPKTP